ncbi:MAG: cytidylate kinase-like family protein [Candidatus Geothermincolia bacterium]
MAILTISRQYGSGGREIGRAVAEDLGYAYEDHATVLAHLRGLDRRWVRWAEELDERRPSAWERYDWSFRGYVALMQEHLIAAASRDRVVIVGRGGNVLLEGVRTAYRIRVTAPLEERIERILQRELTDRESAKQLVERTDSEREGFVRAVYGRGWDDPAAFDAVFDTGRQGRAAIVSLIKDALMERDRADRAAAGGLLARRLAAAEVRVALFTDPHVQLPLLEVAEGEGEIVVRGVVHTTEERTRVMDAACRVSATLPLRFELRFRG